MWGWLAACAPSHGPGLDDPAALPSPAPPSPLAGAASPYLRAHAADLVSWRPWGPAAFAEARRLDRPVLLVIGYATCHWCHVLAEESFRDPVLAPWIDRTFVPVLVDREERPDVDAAQLRAAQLLTGRGLGWPLLVVLDPDGAVLFANSYLPPHDGDRGVKTGLSTVLHDVAGRWGTDREGLLDRGRALAQDLAAGGPAGGPLPPSVGRDVDRALAAKADREHGGFGGAPKFPRPVTLDAWATWSVRHGAPGGREHVLRTLRILAASALHDPLDGGFHRYATDAAWTEVHFEKTLTDNAQLGVSYLDARRLDPDPAFPAVARDVARYLAGTWAGRGLAAAIDADSAAPDGSLAEGAYSLLSRADLAQVLAPEAAAAAADALGLPAEGPAAPRTVGPLDDEARAAIVALRLSRPPPARDDKAVVGWEGLAVAFLARAGRELPDPAAAALALRLGEVVGRELDAGLPSRVIGGDAPPLLDDAAFAAAGMLELFLATGDPAWLRRAQAAVRLADDRFAKPGGGHWRSAAAEPPLPVRPTADEDGAEPPAAAVLARARLRLSALTGDGAARNRAQSDLLATSGAIAERPASHTAWLRVADALDRPPPEVVVVVPPGADGAPLTTALWSSPDPDGVELVLAPAQVTALAPEVPLLEGKAEVAVPTAFVCTLGVCQAPATTPDALRASLSAAQR